MHSAWQSNLEQICVKIYSKDDHVWVVNFFVCHLDLILVADNILFLYYSGDITIINIYC